MNANAHQQLQEQLDDVALHAQHRLQAASRRDASRRSLGRTLWWCLLIPALALTIQCGRLLFGASPGLFWWWLVLLSFVPAAVVFAMTRMADAEAISREKGLLAADKASNAVDRLITADAFLKHNQKTGFMQAAIDDANDFVAPAQNVDIAPVPASWGIRSRDYVVFPVMIGLLLLALFLSTIAPALLNQQGDEHPGRQQVAAVHAESDATQDIEITTTPVPPPPTQEKPAATPRDQMMREHGAPSSKAIPDEAREARGSLGEGQVSESDQSSSPSNARGEPSSQGQPSKPGKQPKKKPSKPKDRKPDQQQAKQPEKKESDPAGSTAGQGSSKGSNKNPAVSDWSSRDQVSTPDDDQVEEEDDIEDEEEEQESRGGMQPNLRDRRPPVNRDLRIGFGNQKNPDANGRGGPSAAKKSRGVASFVLGVPIPDRVKGQPNPGKTKVTQQRIEPEEEPSDTVDASDRGERLGQVGPIYRPVMSPWMQSLVRAYFYRAKEGDKSTVE